MTVPKQPSHEGVAILCPPEEDSLNPGKKAQVDEEEVERFVSGASMYDEAGNEYPVDDAGQLYVPLGYEPEVTELMIEEEKQNQTKN